MSRRSVALQTRATGINEFGERIGTWSLTKNLGARITALSLTETTALNREITTEILLFDFARSPTSSGITTLDRIVYANRNYYVIAVDNLPGSTDVRVTAEERT